MASLMGGVAVLLPSLLLINIFAWLIKWINNAIQPFVAIIINNFHLSPLLSKSLVMTTFIVICFLAGILIKNRLGAIVIQGTEKLILNRFPLYETLKEIVGYFLASDKKSAFSQPVLIKPWGEDTWLTGFVVDENEYGYFSVFVPTSPNPTSGFLMHVPADRTRLLDVPGSQVFKTIISCGSGSSQLLNKLNIQMTDLKQDIKK